MAVIILLTAVWDLLVGIVAFCVFLLILWHLKCAQPGNKTAEETKFTPEVILWTVENADLVNPQDNFRTVAPYVHQFPKAMERVNMYGNLSRVYSETLVEKYGNDFPLEIEKAVICLEYSHLIYYLTDAGHIWSVEAGELMKQEHPLAYEHNVEEIRRALIYLAEHKNGLWCDAEGKAGISRMRQFEMLGYILRTENTWQISEKGLEQAEFCRKQMQQQTGEG